MFSQGKVTDLRVSVSALSASILGFMDIRAPLVARHGFGRIPMTSSRLLHVWK